jgi:hypothetical protein
MAKPLPEQLRQVGQGPRRARGRASPRRMRAAACRLTLGALRRTAGWCSGYAARRPAQSALRRLGAKNGAPAAAAASPPLWGAQTLNPSRAARPHSTPALCLTPPWQWFDAIDKDHNGRLTAMELQSALQLGGLNFSLATVAHIIRWGRPGATGQAARRCGNKVLL